MKHTVPTKPDCPKCDGIHFGDVAGNCPLSADYVTSKPWPKPDPPAAMRERFEKWFRNRVLISRDPDESYQVNIHQGPDEADLIEISDNVAEAEFVVRAMKRFAFECWQASLPSSEKIEELSDRIANTLFGGEAADWAQPKIAEVLREGLRGK